MQQRTLELQSNHHTRHLYYYTKRPAQNSTIINHTKHLPGVSLVNFCFKHNHTRQQATPNTYSGAPLSELALYKPRGRLLHNALSSRFNHIPMTRDDSVVVPLSDPLG